MLTKKNPFDKNCEELAFPQFLAKGGFDILQNGKYSYLHQSILIKDFGITNKVLHKILITFFFFFLKKNFRDQISVAVKKKMGNFTAGMFKDNKHYVEEQVNNNQGFYFMNQIKETPAY